MIDLRCSVKVKKKKIAKIESGVNLLKYFLSFWSIFFDLHHSFLTFSIDTCSSYLCMTTYVLAAILLVVLLCVFGFGKCFYQISVIILLPLFVLPRMPGLL